MVPDALLLRLHQLSVLSIDKIHVLLLLLDKIGRVIDERLLGRGFFELVEQQNAGIDEADQPNGEHDILKVIPFTHDIFIIGPGEAAAT